MAKLISKSKKQVLSNDLFITRSLNDKMMGLLSKDRSAVLLKTRFGIHTFGMNHAIDVIILDKSNRVVNLKENLKPGRVFFWNPQHDKVIELPAGVIDNTKTQVEDILEILE